MTCNSNAWKLFGAVVAVAAAALMVSMYPDLKRYIKIESMQAAMHELSIALSIVDRVLEKLEEDGGGKVEAVHLKIGAFSGVEKEALEFSYGLACEGTPLEGSRLMVEDVPLRIYCPACRAESPPLSSYQLACPMCHTPAERVTQGKELELKAFEVAA